jgi:hypothetical protein
MRRYKTKLLEDPAYQDALAEDVVLIHQKETEAIDGWLQFFSTPTAPKEPAVPTSNVLREDLHQRLIKWRQHTKKECPFPLLESDIITDAAIAAIVALGRFIRGTGPVPITLDWLDAHGSWTTSTSDLVSMLEVINQWKEVHKTSGKRSRPTDLLAKSSDPLKSSPCQASADSTDHAPRPSAVKPVKVPRRSAVNTSFNFARRPRGTTTDENGNITEKRASKPSARMSEAILEADAMEYD